MLPFGSSSMCQVNYKTVRPEKGFKIFRFLREYNRFSLIRLWCSFFLQLLGHRVHLNVLGSEKYQLKEDMYGKESQKKTQNLRLLPIGVEGGSCLPLFSRIFPGLPKHVLHLVWIVYCSYQAYWMTLILCLYMLLVSGGSSLNMSNIDILFPQTFSKDIATIFEWHISLSQEECLCLGGGGGERTVINTAINGQYRKPQ